ncbi:hypothetical protein [Sphaerisporangium corydalis]|uniref:Tetratricopeptide repeat protein n=1 Tax=Sphaerisporangium corydalis TaxID=1441875 RepID=A0ABV9E7D1_9ACTN|nr:hypothetical protein [Sphaerisporangium corydalis]
MSVDGYRVLLDCRRRSEILRAQGLGFDQIADIFALYHDVGPLKLHRYARGLTGAEAVAAYNDLDPAGTAALREARLYVFEAWPGSERRPGARALAILARVYRTTARRLVTDEVYASYTVRDRDLIDRADHRHLDSHQHRHVPGPEPVRASMEAEAVYTRGMTSPVSVPGLVPGSALVPALGPGSASSECAALLRALGVEEADVKRRDLLFELALALGGAPAVVLLRHLSPPEKDRLVAAVRTPGRVDAGTVEVVEKLTAHCRRLDDEFGPETVLPIVDSQRILVTGLLDKEVLLPSLRVRLTHTYAQLSQLAGYLHYDLMDYAGARRRYEEALEAAHEVREPALIIYLHTCMSWMAIDQGKVGLALDHAYAAEGWIRHCRSVLARSVHMMNLARVLAHDGRFIDSERALDQSLKLVQRPPDEADPVYLYWCTPDWMQNHAAECLLTLRRFEDTIRSAERTLAGSTTPALVRGQALLYYANALTAKREIPSAVARIRDAARLTRTHTSGRLPHAIRQARAHLRPWEANKHVRHLDDELLSLRIAAHVKDDQ